MLFFFKGTAGEGSNQLTPCYLSTSYQFLPQGVTLSLPWSRGRTRLYKVDVSFAALRTRLLFKSTVELHLSVQRVYRKLLTLLNDCSL